ncbi:MAG: glycosyltransferase [bacterium]|nr:glycosyltransferase [bacterium]
MRLPLALHVITTLDIGGTELTVLRLAADLTSRGFASVVVSLSRAGSAEHLFKESLIPVVCLNASSMLDAPLTLARFLQTVRRLQPAVIHTWMYHTHWLGPVGLVAAPRARVVWSVRTSADPAYRHPTHTLLARRLARTLSGLPDTIVFNSRTVLDTHRQTGFRVARSTVIPNGVDTSRFRPCPQTRERARRALGIVDTDVLVGYVARFHPVKDHRTLLSAVAALRGDLPSVKLLLVGRGTDSPDAAAIIRQFGLGGGVQALGERTDVADITAALDIAVCTSLSEGSANVIAEAMACGIPCVATDVGDARDMLDGCGEVVPARDAVGLSESLCRLAISPDDRARASPPARARAMERYSLERFLSAYGTLYHSLLQGSEFVRQEGAKRDDS